MSPTFHLDHQAVSDTIQRNTCILHDSLELLTISWAKISVTAVATFSVTFEDYKR